MTFAKLKNHPLFKVGLTYFALAWLVIQVIGTLTMIYSLPGILVYGFMFMLIGGYPIVMMLAWAFNLTHQSDKWEKDDRSPEQKAQAVKRFYIFIWIVMFMALVLLLADIFVLGKSS